MKFGVTMHIPDGYLDSSVILLTYLISLSYGSYSYYRVKNILDPDKITLISVLGAGIFVAQMLNWPIPGGTSLHFVGGALAGILTGPWFGFFTMTIVVVIQCLIFHDGGITALGANLLNMAIIDVLIGYMLYYNLVKLFRGRSHIRFVSAFLGGWVGITLAGFLCGLEIGYSSLFPYGVFITVPIMTVWHMILGVIEGFATGLVVMYITRRESKLFLARVGEEYV